jgi:membrane protease YdiL (CAAX protease family)
MQLINNYNETYKSLFYLDKKINNKFIFLFNIFLISASALVFFQYINRIIFMLWNYSQVNANMPPIDNSLVTLGWYFLEIIIIGPIIEELIFRFPLNQKFMKVNWFSIFLLSGFFAFIHIFNFTNYLDGLDMQGFLMRLIFVPIILLPYFSLGVLLSIIRLKLGLIYSVLLHATINFSIFGSILISGLISYITNIDYQNILNLFDAILITIFLISLIVTFKSRKNQSLIKSKHICNIATFYK